MDETLTESGVKSSLPAGWVPEGTVVWVLVHRDHEDEPWEALVPEFAIASQGKTPEDALHSAAELLDDYLLLCERDGKTFAEARRVMSFRAMVTLGAHGLAAWLFGVRRRRQPPTRAPRRHRLLRLPLDRGLLAH